MSAREQWMRSALSELMEVDPMDLSVTKSLAEQGVDSLVGLRFARRIQEHVGAEVELEWLYDNPTIRELSVFLDDKFGSIKATPDRTEADHRLET